MEGLFRRGGVWWVRLVVPHRLREEAGRREFVKSTGVHDLVVAKLVASALMSGWRRQLYELERGCMDDEGILRLVEGSASLTGGDFLSLGRAAQLTGLQIDDLLREAESRRLSLGCRVPLGMGAGFTVDVTTLERSGPGGGYVVPHAHPRGSLPADCGGEVLRLYDGGDDVAKAIIASGLERVDIVMLEREWGKWRQAFVPDQSLRIEVAALELRSHEVEAIRLARAAKVLPERVERARAAVTAQKKTPHLAGKWAARRFTEAVRAYCDDPDGLPRTLVSKQERGQRESGMLGFAEFMGDMVLSDIDDDVLRAFRDGPLKTIPANANKLPSTIRKGTMRETIDALHADGRPWPTLSDEMRHERMLWLIRMFEWLQGRGYLNPAPGAALRKETGMSKADHEERKRLDPEDETGREPFTEEQLQAIFAQTHFSTGSGRHLHKPRIWYPFEYWLPLLGLYAGVRIGEGSQLHLVDVQESDGIWVLDINKRTADKSVKNAQSIRKIPVHQELIRLGFVDYCKRLRALGFRRVFPELTWVKSDARYGKESGRKMSEMLRRLGMPRDGTLVFHCLRHNFNNAMMRVSADVLPGGDEHLKKFIRLTVMGHEVGEDVNARHYSHTKPSEMALLINQVTYSLPSVLAFDVQFAVEQVWVGLNNKDEERHGKEDLGPLGAFVPGGAH